MYEPDCGSADPLIAAIAIIGTDLGIDGRLLAAAKRAAARSRTARASVAATRTTNHLKVARAFREVGVEEYHFHGTSGYGYGDSGREALQAVYAKAFGAESALVAPYLVSGTHALTAALFGCLRPGDHLLYATGAPYDTLQAVIGANGRHAGEGTLADFEVEFSSCELAADGAIDLAAVLAAVRPETRLVAFQRSCGYAWTPSRNVKQLGVAIAAIKSCRPDIVVMVDNCYGEFVETEEPLAVGADLICGSLIKNPGGSLAPVGGYVAGKAEFVKLAAARATAPGIAGEVGPTLDLLRLLFQGLYVAPLFVAEAVSGALFSAALFEELGLPTTPGSALPRTDLIQAVRLDSAERVIAFCQGLQTAAPINANVLPEPGDMPGYEHQVIMAGGGFVTGATLEFSADAPLRPPYVVYMQGGLALEQVVAGVLRGVQNLLQKGLLGQ